MEYSADIRRIKHLVKEREIVVEHIFRKGNKVADLLANHMFSL